ncbi:MAG: F0F1 ATP synthase subunit B [Filifactor alocis]|nr:F0F1 ATP synthase subunit B [Filifactor alocis]
MNLIKEGLVALGGWQILLTMLNTLVLYLGLKRFLFEPVKNFMDERTKSIEDQITQAKEKEELADRKLSDYEERIKNAREEGREIVRLARQSAEKQHEEIVEHAKAEAEQIFKKKQEQLKREKQQAVHSIKNEISDIALMVAEKVIQKNLTPQDQSQLIDEFINNVGDTKWEN